MPRRKKIVLLYDEKFIVKNEAEASEKRMELWNKGYKFSEISTTSFFDKWGDYYKVVKPIKATV